MGGDKRSIIEVERERILKVRYKYEILYYISSLTPLMSRVLPMRSGQPPEVENTKRIGY
ncbi:MAG: hypothetical protein Q9N32_03610 [Gammaproteobacteria bacterium]|nr:hypothetical protein [Gammaproteobacteria bacterium]